MRGPVNKVHVFPVDLADAPPAAAQCWSCGRAPARSTVFCPYCSSAQPAAAKASAKQDTPDDNVVHARFGAGADPAAHQREVLEPAVGIETAPTEVVATPVPATPDANTAGSNAAAVPTKARSGRRWDLIWIAVGGMALALLIVIMGASSRHPSAVADAGQSEIGVFSVRDDTAVRNAPTTQNSTKLGTLERGASIRGMWLDRNAAGYRWFKISSGPFAGAFVWERNLSSTAPVKLSALIGGNKWSLTAVNAYSGPDPAAPIADTIAPRHSVFVVGSVDGNWYEIRLKRGGIAYVQSSSLE
jgi:hypothetical protein